MNLAAKELQNITPTQFPELLHGIAQALQDCSVCILDPEGRIVSWNIGTQNIHGYTAEEILHHHFSKFRPRENQERRKAQQILERAFREGYAVDEGWRVRKDGSFFWAKVHIIPIKSRDKGASIGFVKITRDITGKKEASNAPEQSAEYRWQVEQQHQFLIDVLPDSAVFTLDREKRVANWNPNAQRITGFNPDEIVGHPFARFFTEDDLRQKKPFILLYIAKAKGRATEQGWRVRKDGTHFFVETVIAPIYTLKGGVCGFAHAMRDLGNAEEIKSGPSIPKTGLEKVLQNLEEAAVVFNHADTVIYSNQKAVEIAGVLTGHK